MIKNILAVDPGYATGVVLFTPISRLEIAVHMCREIVGPQRFYDWLRALDDTVYGRPEHCVCEDWTPRGGRPKTWQPEPIRIAGALEFWFGTDNISFQMPGAAMSWGTTKKVQEYTYVVPPTKDGHQQMALRHALLWTSTHFQEQED